MKRMALLFIGLLYIDMYQDALDKNSTVIVVTQDDVVTTVSVKNSDLSKPDLINKIEEKVNGKH